MVCCVLIFFRLPSFVRVQIALRFFAAACYALCLGPNVLTAHTAKLHGKLVYVDRALQILRNMQKKATLGHTLLLARLMFALHRSALHRSRQISLAL